MQSTLCPLQLTTAAKRLVTEGQGGFVIIEADAGLGKTRLLEDFKAAEAVSRWATGASPAIRIFSSKGDASRTSQAAFPLNFSHHSVK